MSRATTEIEVAGENEANMEQSALGVFVPLSEDVLSWLDETNASTDPLDLFTITPRISIRLQERGETENSIKRTLRILAPLDWLIRRPNESPWNSCFSPWRNGNDGADEYPSLADLSADDVEEWASFTMVLKRAIVRARFADAVWELGKRLGSPRTDLHLFARLASELYIEAASTNTSPQRALSMLEAATRGISLAMQFRISTLVDTASAA